MKSEHGVPFEPSRSQKPQATREAQTQFVRLDTDVASQSINDIGQSVNKKVERRVKVRRVQSPLTTHPHTTTEQVKSHPDTYFVPD